MGQCSKTQKDGNSHVHPTSFIESVFRVLATRGRNLLAIYTVCMNAGLYIMKIPCCNAADFDALASKLMERV